jgi:hypothetical protein
VTGVATYFLFQYGAGRQIRTEAIATLSQDNDDRSDRIGSSVRAVDLLRKGKVGGRQVCETLAALGLTAQVILLDGDCSFGDRSNPKWPRPFCDLVARFLQRCPYMVAVPLQSTRPVRP